MKKEIQACDLVIFGTKGDLARRKLLPSLYQLEKYNKIHKNSRIIGVGRANWDKKTYINIVYDALKTFMKEKIDTVLLNRLSNRLYFCNIDVNDTLSFKKLKKFLDQKNRITINYFAMPPNTFGIISQGLGFAKLNSKHSRIIIEKPLGYSLKTFLDINHQISKFFKESQIFRIDHYLGKETILNLLSLRFSNSFFFNNWNNNTIDHVQITASENVGIEGRWGYFNEIGQMRDMVQNHILQILTIIAMSPPDNLSSDNIRNEKVKILRSLRRINCCNVYKKTVRGQYTAGYINNKKVPGYLEENGAIINSNTETYVAIKANIDNWRWYGVPFYLRTGKRLPYKFSEVIICFKKPIINLFPENLINNKLIIRLQPNEGIKLQMLNKIPDINSEYKLKIVNLNFKYSKTFKNAVLFDAYERLLLESMTGSQSLFVRYDEVEEAWRWTDSIIHAWKKTDTPLQKYQAGTWGPQDALKINNGYNWYKEADR